MTPEGKVKKLCTDLLKKYKAHYFMPVSNGMGRAGVSDIIGCFQGKYFVIEVKSATGKPTPLQLKFIQEVKDADGKAFIVNGAEALKEVEGWLKEVTNERI